MAPTLSHIRAVLSDDPNQYFRSKFAPKSYEAKTILLLQETGKDNPFLKDFVVGLNLKDRIFALQTLLRSEHVLLNVLRDLRGKDIEKDPEKLAVEMRQLSGNISVQLVGSDLIELKLKGSKPADNRQDAVRSVDALPRTLAVARTQHARLDAILPEGTT